MIFDGGRTPVRPLLDWTPEEARQSWQREGLAAFVVGQEAMTRLLARQRGTMLFVGRSEQDNLSCPFSMGRANKAGARALAQSMARAFGPKNIHVAHVSLASEPLDHSIDAVRALAHAWPTLPYPCYEPANKDMKWVLWSSRTSGSGVVSSTLGGSGRSIPETVLTSACGTRSPGPPPPPQDGSKRVVSARAAHMEGLGKFMVWSLVVVLSERPPSAAPRHSIFRSSPSPSLPWRRLHQILPLPASQWTTLSNCCDVWGWDNKPSTT